MDPLGAELDGQGPQAGILQHPLGLLGEHLRFMQAAGGGQLAQFVVGYGRPEEIAEPGGKLPIVDGARFLAGWCLLQVEEERGRYQHPRQDIAKRLLAGDVLLAKRGIESQEIGFLLLLQGTAISPGGQGEKRLQLLRPCHLHFLFEGLRPLAERVPQPLKVDHKGLRLVLGHEADEERQVLVLGDRPLC